MLEEDYLKDTKTQSHQATTAGYNFTDPRSKALNEYSTQLIKELIIPKLTREVNSSKRYAPLRQAYYSLILSRWFKNKFAANRDGSQTENPIAENRPYPLQGTVPKFVALINKQDLTNLTSQTPWSKTTYFNQYKKSFTDGEYNIKEKVYTPTGQVIRSYFSGGIAATNFVYENGFQILPHALNRMKSKIPGDGILATGNGRDIKRTLALIGEILFNKKTGLISEEFPVFPAKPSGDSLSAGSPMSLKQTVVFLDGLTFNLHIDSWLSFQIGGSGPFQVDGKSGKAIIEGVKWYNVPDKKVPAGKNIIVIAETVDPLKLLSALSKHIRGLFVKKEQGEPIEVKSPNLFADKIDEQIALINFDNLVEELRNLISEFDSLLKEVRPHMRYFNYKEQSFETDVNEKWDAAMDGMRLGRSITEKADSINAKIRELEQKALVLINLNPSLNNYVKTEIGDLYRAEQDTAAEWILKNWGGSFDKNLQIVVGRLPAAGSPVGIDGLTDLLGDENINYEFAKNLHQMLSNRPGGYKGQWLQMVHKPFRIGEAEFRAVMVKKLEGLPEPYEIILDGYHGVRVTIRFLPVLKEGTISAGDLIQIAISEESADKLNSNNDAAKQMINVLREAVSLISAEEAQNSKRWGVMPSLREGENPLGISGSPIENTISKKFDDNLTIEVKKELGKDFALLSFISPGFTIIGTSIRNYRRVTAQEIADSIIKLLTGLKFKAKNLSDFEQLTQIAQRLSLPMLLLDEEKQQMLSLLIAEVKKAEEALPEDVNEQVLKFFPCVGNTGDPLYPILPQDTIMVGHVRDDRAAYFARGLWKRGFHNLLGYIRFSDDFQGKAVLPDELIASVPNTFFGRLSDRNYTVLEVSEDEKKEHVAKNANGRRKGGLFPGQRQIVIPMQESKKAYVDTPQMRMQECANAVLEGLDEENLDFILVNFLSSDMMKHTGNFEAAKKSNEITDQQLGRIKDRIGKIKNDILQKIWDEVGNATLESQKQELLFSLLSQDYDRFLEELKKLDSALYTKVKGFEAKIPVFVITADHGASEAGLVPGKPKESDTFHTANPVPYIIYDPLGNKKLSLKSGGSIINNAATLLHLLGEEVPEEYEQSLLPNDYKGSKRRIAFAVLDGWGINPDQNYEGDAIRLAHTPNYDWLVENASFTQVEARGELIGLREGQLSFEEGRHHLRGLQAGQTDIGHLHMFSGREIKQPLWYMDRLIKGSLRDGIFDESKEEIKALIKELQRAKGNNSRFHYVAIASEGGVHSSLYHMYALMRLAKKLGLSSDQFVIHFAADGRDVPTRTAHLYLQDVKRRIDEIGIGVISTVFGRDMFVRKGGAEDITDRIVDVQSGIGLNAKDVTLIKVAASPMGPAGDGTSQDLTQDERLAAEAIRLIPILDDLQRKTNHFRELQLHPIRWHNDILRAEFKKATEDFYVEISKSFSQVSLDWRLLIEYKRLVDELESLRTLLGSELREPSIKEITGTCDKIIRAFDALWPAVNHVAQGGKMQEWKSLAVSGSPLSAELLKELEILPVLSEEEALAVLHEKARKFDEILEALRNTLRGLENKYTGFERTTQLLSSRAVELYFARNVNIRSEAKIREAVNKFNQAVADAITEVKGAAGSPVTIETDNLIKGLSSETEILRMFEKELGVDEFAWDNLPRLLHYWASEILQRGKRLDAEAFVTSAITAALERSGKKEKDLKSFMSSFAKNQYGLQFVDTDPVVLILAYLLRGAGLKETAQTPWLARVAERFGSKKFTREVQQVVNGYVSEFPVFSGRVSRQASAQEGIESPGIAGSPIEMLPNDDYTEDIRENISKKKFFAIQIDQFSPGQNPVVSKASLFFAAAGREAMMIDRRIQMSLSQKYINTLIEAIRSLGYDLQKKLADMQILFIPGQKAYYGLGRPQILLDLDLLKGGYVRKEKLAKALREGIIAREIILNELSAQNPDWLKELEATKHSPQTRSPQLKKAIKEALGRFDQELVDKLIEDVQSREAPLWMAKEYRPGRVFVHPDGDDLDSVMGRIAEAEKTLHMATDDPDMRSRVQDALLYLAAHPDATKLTLAEFTGVALRLVRQLTHNDDPWKGHKRKLDAEAKAIYDKFASKVGQIRNSRGQNEAIRAALIYATVGNLLDATNPGVLTSIAQSLGLPSGEITPDYLEQIMDKVYTKVNSEHDRFILDELSDFLNGIEGKEGETILYFLDNHGEVVFDQLVIGQLISAGYRVVAVARGEPVQEDVTQEEALRFFQDKDSWLEFPLKIGQLKVVTDGSYFLGADLRQSGKQFEFIDAWKDAAGIIVKGAGAFQTLAGEAITKPVLFARMMKQSATDFAWLREHRDVETPKDNGTPFDMLFMYQPAAGLERNENIVKESAGSPVLGRTGGIDLRSLPMTIQPMGSFKGLDFVLPKLSSSALESINVAKEIESFNNMLKAGIMPSEVRLEEVVAASIQKEEITLYAESLRSLAVDICKLQEETATESSPELREALAILDSISG
ncbi:MAG: ARMT1-like domain-containing protein [Candidatus Omnitrophota bacterium]